jgi:hypothetical protein
MELLRDGISWKAVIGTIVFLGFAPGLAMRLMVFAWPPRHSRRRELLAELSSIEYCKRPFWVLEQLENALIDGFGARYQSRRKRKQSESLASETEPWQLRPVASFPGVVGDARLIAERVRELAVLWASGEEYFTRDDGEDACIATSDWRELCEYVERLESNGFRDLSQYMRCRGRHSWWINIDFAGLEGSILRQSQAVPCAPETG